MIALIIALWVLAVYYSYNLGKLNGHSHGFKVGMEASDDYWEKALKHYKRVDDE